MIFDTLDQLEAYIPVLPALRQVADAMDHDDVYSKDKGRYKTPAKEVTYEVMEYMSDAAEAPFMFHRSKTVVEIVLEGEELLSTTWRELQKEADAYDKDRDVGFVHGEPLSVLRASQGRFSVFFPGECYRSSNAGTSARVKKAVFTVNE